MCCSSLLTIPWAKPDPARGEPGLTYLSVQQIARVDPDVILVQSFAPGRQPLSQQFRHNRAWNQLRAVQTGQVYEIDPFWHWGNGTQVIRLMLAKVFAADLSSLRCPGVPAPWSASARLMRTHGIRLSGSGQNGSGSGTEHPCLPAAANGGGTLRANGTILQSPFAHRPRYHPQSRSCGSGNKAFDGESERLETRHEPGSAEESIAISGHRCAGCGGGVGNQPLRRGAVAIAHRPARHVGTAGDFFCCGLPAW